MPSQSSTGSGRTLSAFLDEVAAGTPVPGGGSVAAIAGALAAALGEMVVNFTDQNALDPEAAAALRDALPALTSLRRVLMAAADEDEAAYAGYRAALALPRGTDTEKAARQTARQEALLRATEAPLAVARAAHELLHLLETVARAGNRRLGDDAALGALLAETALRGALLNVRGNAALLADPDRAAGYREEADRLEREGRGAAERAYRLATAEERAAR
jgi:formiminotetrahydrofolate cyclodeaminase